MTVSASPAAHGNSNRNRNRNRNRLDLTTDHRLVRWSIGATTLAAGLLVAGRYRADPLSAICLVFVVTAYGFLAAIDVKEQRLPNRITLPLAGMTIVAVLTTGFVGGQMVRALTAIAVGIGFSALLGILRFGMGDIKLAVTVGTIAAWFGRDAILATIYIGAAGGAAAAVVLMIVHRRRDVTFGFGPFLAIGSVAGILVAG